MAVRCFSRSLTRLRSSVTSSLSTDASPPLPQRELLSPSCSVSCEEIFVVLENYTSKFGAEIERLATSPNVYFVDFLQEPGLDPVTEEPVPAPRIYEPINADDMPACKKMSNEYMAKFNNQVPNEARRKAAPAEPPIIPMG